MLLVPKQPEPIFLSLTPDGAVSLGYAVTVADSPFRYMYLVLCYMPLSMLLCCQRKSTLRE